MEEEIIQLAKKFVSENEGWYIDTHSTYTEIGMENKENFGGFLASLEDRRIEYHIIQSGLDGWYIVKVSV